MPNKFTCMQCLHYEPCFDYGNILDPIHGGITCDSFKHKDKYEEIRVGQWTPYEYYISEDSNCLIDKTVVRVDPISFRCSLCGRIEEKQEPYCHCGAKMKAWND